MNTVYYTLITYHQYTVILPYADNDAEPVAEDENEIYLILHYFNNEKSLYFNNTPPLPERFDEFNHSNIIRIIQMLQG